MKRLDAGSVGFLLAQVGAHANLAFAQRLAPTGLSPALAGALWAAAATEGTTQQALAARVGSHPSRIVALVDELERHGLVERRKNESDRRSYAIHLTSEGHARLRAVGAIAREHQAALCAALDERERALLASLLRRIADQQGLPPGVHPGFRHG